MTGWIGFVIGIMGLVIGRIGDVGRFKVGGRR
jgi:hypothetical protein